MIEIVNAKIRSTTIGLEDHGIMTIFIDLDYGNSSQGFGGYELDNYDKTIKKRIPHVRLSQFITQVLKVVGVAKWEDLPGKIIRVKTEHMKCYAIGNVLKDEWFDPGKELQYV